jgi:large subunit ribosomal protein L25
MKAAIEINATVRATLGKGGSRALRREARVPVVVYANGKNTLSLSVDGKSVANEYFKGGFMSKIVALKVDGKDVFAIPRDVQLNPVSDKIEHVDFLHVDDKSVVKVTVPVHFLNTEKSVGIKRGGVLNIVAHTVELLCPVSSIPKALEIDIAALNIGDSVHIHNVALPAGVKPATKGRDLTIASLTGRQKEEAEVATSAVSAGAVPAAKVAEQAAGAKPAAGGKAAPAAAKPAAKK